MNIDHVNIKAKAGLLERVRDFYCSILALTEGPRPAFRKHGYWLYSGNQAIIHLIESDGLHEEGNQGAIDHFALRVNDLSPFLARLEESGTQYRTSLVEDIGLRQVFFKDPAGSGVEISCPD